MIIHLNGIREIIPEGMTIETIIEWAKEGDPHVIVERNGRYVYPSAYESQNVFENDVIEFIYFADKLCNGHWIDLNYHKRFAGCLMKSPWAMTSISKRYENTQLIQARIEASAGKPVKEILSR